MMENMIIFLCPGCGPDLHAFSVLFLVSLLFLVGLFAARWADTAQVTGPRLMSCMLEITKLKGVKEPKAGIFIYEFGVF